MRALVKVERAPGLRLQEVETPLAGQGEVLIRVKKAAICGTDLHIYKWDDWAQKVITPPLILGHEFVGEVAALGEGVTAFTLGQRVTAEGHINCGRCYACQTAKRHLCEQLKNLGVHRSGAFAEYVSIPEGNVFALPDSISDDWAAILDPFGNATHTALSFPLAAEDVLITGAGPIGLMCVAIARHVGARSITITDVHPQRLEWAKALGASHVLNVDHSRLRDLRAQLPLNGGFGVGLEVSGHPNAFASLVRAMAPGGSVALLGFLPENTLVEWEKILFKGLMIKGIYGREVFQTWYQMTALLENGLDLSPLITHRFSFDDYEKAFQLLLKGDGAKVLLEWP